MDILRRNTDYALRMMLHLAKCWGREPISTRIVSLEQDIPYQLACKLMQKLHKAKLIDSCMGPKGGFQLSKEPSKVNLLEIITTIQGPVSLNRCLTDASVCARQPKCPVNRRLAKLQKQFESFLCGITLAQLLGDKGSKGEKRSSKHKQKIR